MADDDRISTDELLALLFKERNLERFLQRNESAYLTASFGEYLNQWCRQHLEVPERVIRRANLEKSYGHQLFNGKRNPSRDTVLQLAFAMEADLPQAQEMLRIARRSLLYPRIKRDAAIICCLHNRIPLVDTQIILQDLELPLLGGSRKVKELKRIVADMETVFAQSSYPRDFLATYDQMECLANHTGRETLLVRRKADGRMAVAT